MKSRPLFLAIASFVLLLFVGNYAVIRSQSSCPGTPGDCQCQVSLVRSGASASTNPSCSVTSFFSGHSKLSNCDIIEPGFLDRIVKCDTGIKAILTCRGSRHVVKAGKAMRLECDTSGTYPTVKSSHESSWENNVGGTNTNATLSLARSGIRRLLGEGEGVRQHGLITETERITLINGDVGIMMEKEQPLVMLTAGEAIVESFCNGSTARLKAPAILRLPNFIGYANPLLGVPMEMKPCVPANLTGRWYGAYRRVDKDGNGQEISVRIDLRDKPGTVETPDGVFDVTEFNTSRDSFSLSAKARSGAGVLDFNGTFDKGGMSFQFREDKTGQDGSVRGSGGGQAERLYIAQWAVGEAALDTPYSHALLALSPAKGPLTWSVVSGSLPDGLSLDSTTGVLSGTPSALGSRDFTVEVRDANGDSFQQPFSFLVSRIVLTTATLPAAFPGQEYRFQLAASGGAQPLVFTNMLSFPFQVPGMPPLPQVSPEGEITFTPEKEGGLLMLRIDDASGNSRTYSLSIEARALTILGSEFLPPAVAGTPFSYTFTTGGQRASVTWNEDTEGLDGTGLTLDAATGTLSGTPAQAGQFLLHMLASDGKSDVSRDFVLSVTAPPAAAPAAACCSAASRRGVAR